MANIYEVLGTADNRNSHAVVAPRAALLSWPMCRSSNSSYGSETASVAVPPLDAAVLNRRRLTISPAESHPEAVVQPWQLRAYRRRATKTLQARSELPLRRRQRRRPPRRRQATTHRRKRRRHRRRRRTLRTAATSPRKVVVVLRRGMTLRRMTQRKSPSVNWQVSYSWFHGGSNEVENKGRSRH